MTKVFKEIRIAQLCESGRYLNIYTSYYRPVLEVDSDAVHFYKPEGLFRIYMDCLYVHILEFARLSNFQGLSSVVLVHIEARGHNRV